MAVPNDRADIVDKESFTHHILYNAFKRVTAAYSTDEKAALFHNTAVRVCRI